MGLLEQAREEFIEVCRGRPVVRAKLIAVRPLSADEAIGREADREFVIVKGKEVVIEATFGDCRGQAFTDSPSRWTRTLRELIDLDLTDVRCRALFVAGMSAVLRSLDLVEGTVHCLDKEPTECGPRMAEEMERRFGERRFALIGLQPAILSALVERFGRDNVSVADLNPDNIGQVRCGVPVRDGAQQLPQIVSWCDVGLATGSSVVNGTIDEIVDLFAAAGKPLVFFGSTISGVAALLGLDRVCFFGR